MLNTHIDNLDDLIEVIAGEYEDNETQELTTEDLLTLDLLRAFENNDSYQVKA